MIDSLNLFIHGIAKQNIKFSELVLRGAKINNGKKYKGNNNGLYFWITYKDLKFKVVPMRKYLLIITHADKVLQKDIVRLCDKEIYKYKVMEIIKEVVFSSEKFKLRLNRIDFKVDICCETDEMLEIYIDILQKYKNKFKYLKKEKIYTTSIYLGSKNGQITLNFYDKYKESMNEKYRKILRLEIQLEVPFVKARLKQGKEDSIDEYWNKETMEKFYFEVLRKYVYLGDYYKIEKVNKLIDKSKYHSVLKNRLKAFVLEVNKEGISKVFDKKIYSRYIVKTYIEKLEQIGVNPIVIPDSSSYKELPNLYTTAKQIAENEYYV